MKSCSLANNGFYIDTRGRVGQCCIQAKGTQVDWHSVDDLNEWYKKDERLSKIRTSLDDGVEVLECNACWKLENDNRESKRHRVNRLDDSKIVSIKNVDLRMSNKCNLQCKMCSPGFSDQIENLAYELQSLKIDNPLMDEMPSLQNNVDVKKLLDLVLQLPDLETIRFAGGEPFVMPEVEEFLFKLVENNKTDISIEFITNCTSAKTRIVETLEKFKHVELMCSIDGVEEFIEYQRYPARWSTIEKNFIKLYNSKCEVGITPCISMLTYLGLDRFFEWANQFPDARISYNEVDKEFLDFRFIPMSARKEFLNNFEKVKFFDVNKNWKTFQNFTMFEHKIPTAENLIQLKRHINVWDYRCNVKFLDAYPWVKELLNE